MPVYFMQDDKTSLIKIGKANKNLLQRRKALEREFSTTLHIIGVVDGGYKEENQLHKKFSHIRSHREWFEPSSDLVEFIKQNGRTPYEEEIKTPYFTFTFRLPSLLVTRAKAKAGYIPLSVILRKLLENWIKGDIDIDLSKKS